MKKNKKLLMLFMAVNIAASANINTGAGTSKYNKLYKSIVGNIEKNNSNKQNYQIIEEILKKKNAELNDLYIQSDFIVKPEYLEWQILFSSFYAKNIKGDNTFENADYYSTARTKSGKLTINQKTYEDLAASGLSESQIMSLFNGDRKALNSLTEEQKNIFYNQTGAFKSFHRKEKPNNIKLGASIPIKEVLDFTLNPQIDIVEKTMEPISVELPNTRVEKIMITDLRGIAAPEPNVSFESISINPEPVNISPTINFNFTAGHDAGAPKILGGSGVGQQTNIPVNSIKHTGNVVPTTRYYIVNSAGHELYFSQLTDFTFSNTGSNPNGRFYAENSGAAKILANYGTLRIGTGSSDAFIFGDTVDSTVSGGAPFSTTVYNSGKMFINADKAGQKGIPGGVGMAYLSNGDDQNGGAKKRYLVNGLGGEIYINGWGNYGILMNQVDSLPNTHVTSINDGNINLLINKGKVIINVSDRPDGKTEGNVGVAAFADNGIATGNDNSFMLNDSEGIIKSESGNNVLLRHMGTGHVWNKGILEINSNETIGLDRKNWLFNSATANPGSEARGINDGIIIVKDVKNVKAVSGTADMKKHDSTVNNDKTVLIKNGDGRSQGSYYDNSTQNVFSKGINKGKLGLGGIITGSKGMNNTNPDIVADTTTIDTDSDLNNIRGDKARNFDMTINGNGYNYTTQDGVIFLEGRNSVGLMAELKNVESSLPNLNLIKAVNDTDGKIFIYSKGTDSDQYTIGINGSYSTIENKGGIFFGVVPVDGVIAPLASQVTTEGAVSELGNYNYIGIYGSGSDLVNSGFITDKAGTENYSQNAIGIYAENKNFSGTTVGKIINTGEITLGTGGKAIIANGESSSAKIVLSSTGKISISGDEDNLGLGFVLKNTKADISNEINLSKGETIGIHAVQSELNTSNLNITGNDIKGSYGLYIEDSELKLNDGVNINLTGGADNIGIYGKSVIYSDGMSANKNNHLNITLGQNGIGIYLTDLVSDTNLKINKINTGNSILGKQSGGIYAASNSASISIDSGEIKIGNNLEEGKGFGIYVSGKSGSNGEINLGTSDITVNQKSGLGIFAENVSNIRIGNITAGNVGIFHKNTGITGTIKAGKITLLGSEDNMLGLYTTGNATNVEINGLEMSGQEKLTGIYVKNGGFKNTGNILINGGNNSYGIYVVGNTSNKAVDFGSGITNITLGNESLGLYLNNTNVTGNMPANIIVGDSSNIKQSVGMYAEDTSFGNPVNTNISSGKESVGVYFNTNTGSIEYNGNVTLGENSLGIYKKGGIISRNPGSSILFTGINNAQSTGFYLDDSTLNFTSDSLNANTLSMDSGIAFLLKGNNASVKVNNVNITGAQLDSLGLAPKVERIVYSEKNEVISGDINLDSSVRHYGHRAKDGRLEINGNIYANNNIESTYGVAVQDKYTKESVNEEVLLNDSYVIDMTNSLGSMGIQSLAGARVKNQGKIIVGHSSTSSSGIGILAESKNTTDLTNVINDTTGIIEMPNAGIGIYIDSAELGGSILNKGTISSTQEKALGIYSKLSAGAMISGPVTIIENAGTINLSNEGFGIFGENSRIINSGNIKVDSSLNKIIGIYGGKKSVINNTGGTISVGEKGIAFYGDNTEINISGGTFNTENGTLIYAVNNSVVNYNINNVTLGNKIGIYLDESRIDFNGKDLNVLDFGSGIYMIGLSSKAESLGNLNLGNNSEGAYIKNTTLNSLGGNINITGSNSTGIIGINSNIENTSNINTYMSNSTLGNKGMLLKVDDGGVYTIKNKASINLQAANSLGMYGSALDSNGNVSGTLNLINENTIDMGSSFDTNNLIIGMYGTKGVNISNTTTNGNITGGNYTVGMYSAGGNILNDSNIRLGDAGVAVYLSGGTGLINSSSGITVGNGIRKIDSQGKEVIESGVAFYASNGAVLENYTSDITVGRDSIIGYSKDAGTKIINYGNNISLGEEAIGFYAISGTIENNGILTSSGDGVIYFYGKDGKIENNANINGAGNNYGVGIYGKKSKITNTASIYLGDTYYNPAKADSPSDSSHRYAVGIYGDESEINNDGEIHIGKRGIGIYSYSQSGNLINGTNGKIISNSDNAVGLLVEGSGNYSVINNGEIRLSGKNSVGVSINRNTTLINNGLIEVSGENSIGILAEANSKVINYAAVNSLSESIAAIVLKGGSVLENHGIVTGLVLSDDENNAVDGSSSVSVTASNILDYMNKVPGSVMPSYTKPTIINSGTINVDNNFLLDGINLIIKPDLQNPKSSVISSGDVDFIYDAVKVNGGKIEKNMLVEVTPDFAEGTSAATIQMLKTFTSTSGLDINDFDVISQSIMWAITPSYNKDGTSIDLIASKKSFGSLSGGLWYESFADNLDKRYSGSKDNALKIYNKVNWITSDKDLRHVMSSLAGNIYANINQREQDIEITFDNSINFLQESSNNTKENVKINVISGKGKLEEDTDGVVQYDYKTTGIVALREVERTYRHTFAYSAGYAHTSFDLDDANSSKEKADTIQLGLHNKYEINKWKIKNNLMGRVSFHDTDRNIMWPTKDGKSKMNGRYEVYSISSDNVLSKDLFTGKNGSISAYGALKAVYMTRPSFSEDGLEALEVKGNDAWSVKPRAGIELKAKKAVKGTAWSVKGTLDLAYEYELADINEREHAKLRAVEEGYHKLSKPEEDEGSFRTKASLGVEVEERYGIFITGEYLTGSNDKEDYRAGVSLKAVF